VIKILGVLIMKTKDTISMLASLFLSGGMPSMFALLDKNK